MKDKQPAKTVSIDQLYENRKKLHSTPPALRTKLMASADKRPTKTSHWKVIAPTVFASLLVAFIILPIQRPQMMGGEVASESTFDTLLDSAPSAPVQNVNRMMSPEALDLTPQAAPKPMAKSIMASEFNEQEDTEILFELVNEDAAPMHQNELDTTGSLASETQTNIQKLTVINGDFGIFKNCQGEEIRLSAKTKLTGWVSVETLIDGTMQIESLPENPCD